MKTYKKNIEETLVTFHIGGGGGNRTKKKYLDQDMSIESYTDHLFMGYENESEVLEKLTSENENNEEYSESDVLDCFSDRNEEKLKDIYGIDRSELGEYGYKDQDGKWMDVLEGAETGCLDEDGYYDTTVVQHLGECSESELELIMNSSGYVSDDVMMFVKNALGIEAENNVSDEE